MIAVRSSNLAAVDYAGNTLVIAFHSGGVYAYFRVPHEEYSGLLKAESHGKYFHDRVKNRYASRRIQ